MCLTPHNNSVDHGSRSALGYPSDRFFSRYTPPFLPEPQPPIVHETFEVDTGEEAVAKAYIHRLAEDEKRCIDFLFKSSPPAFCCHIRGCGKWLFHRSQIKQHLSKHGYRFRKPFECSWCVYSVQVRIYLLILSCVFSGATFGRQVEAARHIEDKKLCERWCALRFVFQCCENSYGICSPAIGQAVNARGALSVFDAFGIWLEGVHSE